MPTEPMTKPETQQAVEAKTARRGPLRSTQLPKRAAERPNITIAREKMMPIAVWLAPKWSWIASRYTEAPYT